MLNFGNLRREVQGEFLALYMSTLSLRSFTLAITKENSVFLRAIGEDAELSTEANTTNIMFSDLIHFFERRHSAIIGLDNGGVR